MEPSREDPSRKIAAIKAKLAELAEVLGDIATHMKRIADQRQASLPLIAAEASSCVPGLEERVEQAKEVSRKPTERATDCGVPRFRYAQYVEFTSIEEFLKFRDMPAIEAAEAEGVDWAELERRLQEGEA